MSAAYSRSARWILSAPLLAFIGLVVLFPLGYGFYTAMQERTLFSPVPQFIGFDNVATVLADTEFWHSAVFTAIFTAVTVALELALGLGLALLFNRLFPGKRFLMTVVLIPIMVASSLMAVLWRLGLNADIGIVPALMHAVGIDIVLMSPDWVVPTLFVVEGLHWTPLIFLLCYAGLQSVPDELYEAAKMDGAGYRRCLFHIVLPHIRPVIAIAIFLRVIDAAKSFDLIYVLTGGGPGTQTSTTSIYIYKKAFVDGDFGVASAASVVMLLLLLVLVPLVVRQVANR